MKLRDALKYVQDKTWVRIWLGFDTIERSVMFLLDFIKDDLLDRKINSIKVSERDTSISLPTLDVDVLSEE